VKKGLDFTYYLDELLALKVKFHSSCCATRSYGEFEEPELRMGLEYEPRKHIITE
jgi:hypothetical protein